MSANAEEEQGLTEEASPSSGGTTGSTDVEDDPSSQDPGGFKCRFCSKVCRDATGKLGVQRW